MKITIRAEDLVVRHLFGDAEFFLSEAKNHSGHDGRKVQTYVRAAVITGFAALEAAANTMLVLIDQGEDLELHERAFVEEKRIELTSGGYFELMGDRFYSLEQKIAFLHWRQHGVRLDKGSGEWASLVEAKKLRDVIVHSKPGKVSYADLSISAAESCLIAVRRVADLLGCGDLLPKG